MAAVSVGIVDGEARLDLCYEEDSAAETDMNVVCTGSGEFVEIQGTAELPPAEKDAISHRGRAFRALAPVIAAHVITV